jgi:hypothetical protein
VNNKRPATVGTVRVTFELPAEVTARHIALCGEFNDWSTTDWLNARAGSIISRSAATSSRARRSS